MFGAWTATLKATTFHPQTDAINPPDATKSLYLGPDPMVDDASAQVRPG
jgi:hypothetical protein